MEQTLLKSQLYSKPILVFFNPVRGKSRDDIKFDLDRHSCIPQAGVQQHLEVFIYLNGMSHNSLSVGPFHPLNFESEFYKKPMTRLQWHIRTPYQEIHICFQALGNIRVPTVKK